MHTSAATGFWIERTLEYSAKNGGRNLAPVEIKAGILEKGSFEFFRELGYFDFFFKKTTIGIWECFQVVLQILAALFRWCLQNIK